MKGSGSRAANFKRSGPERLPLGLVQTKTAHCTALCCVKNYQVKLWATGIDLELCPPHRREYRETEANEIALKVNAHA